MDRHVRWLRRVVVAGVLARLAVECAVVAVAVSAAAVAVGTGVVVALAVALGSVQLFAVIRVMAAVNANPVNYTYLCGFKDTSHLLEPMTSIRDGHGPCEAELAERGLSYLETVGQPNTDNLIDLFIAPSRLVLVAIGPDGDPMVVLSQMSDGRILVSSPELVPPSSTLLVNQHRGATVADLVARHLERLTDLANHSITPVVTDRRALTEQLRLEWEAWDQLGPFLGPLINVGGNKSLALLQVRIDETVLWERTMTTEAAPSTVGGRAAGQVVMTPTAPTQRGTPPTASQAPAPIAAPTDPMTDQTGATDAPVVAVTAAKTHTALPGATPAPVTQTMAAVAAAAQTHLIQPVATHPAASQPGAKPAPVAQPMAARIVQPVASPSLATQPPSLQPHHGTVSASGQSGAGAASSPPAQEPLPPPQWATRPRRRATDRRP